MAAGRPSTFTSELATKICERIAAGESLRAICRDEDMPAASTVHLWLLSPDHKRFSEQYAIARELQAEYLFDELIEIADDGTNDYVERQNADGGTFTVPNSEHIQRSRLRVDTRKWYISKVLPKKYGEKLDVTSGGKPVPATIVGMRIINDAKDDHGKGD